MTYWHIRDTVVWLTFHLLKFSNFLTQIDKLKRCWINTTLLPITINTLPLMVFVCIMLMKTLLLTSPCCCFTVGLICKWDFTHESKDSIYTKRVLYYYLHSWIGWREQIIFLVGLGYRVIVPSLRGFGETVSIHSKIYWYVMCFHAIYRMRLQIRQNMVLAPYLKTWLLF